MIQFVSFDAAGTLIEHSWDPAGIALSACNDLGLCTSEVEARQKYAALYSRLRSKHEEVERRRDPSEIRAFWVGLIAEWLSELGHDPVLSRELYEMIHGRVFAPGRSIWRLYPDVLPTLEHLRDSGVCLGVISNWDGSLHTILANLGVGDYFDLVLASLEIGIEKPAPGIFDEALERTGAHATSSLHIGDDYFDDYEGARGAGWNALLLDRSGLSAPCKAERISSLTDLLEVVEK